MNQQTERILADTALMATFVLSFLTHENGVMTHSIVSLVFTAVLLHHVKCNWASYRRPRERSKSVSNHTVALLMAGTTVTGLIFWIAGDDYALGHGPISIVAAVAVLPHLWVHRRRALRLIRRTSESRSE